MKVFIKNAELGGSKPQVIAYYPDSSDVSDNAHGDGVTILNVPKEAIVHEVEDVGGFQSPKGIRLAEGWRDRAGPMMMEAEAKRRIDEAASPTELMNTLNEKVDLLLRHGPDVSNWPADAKSRKAEIDHVWNYVGEIKERARAHATSIPPDPTSNKIWPTRFAKKK